MNTKLVYITEPIRGCYGPRIFNYDADNRELNDFLSKFDCWSSHGLRDTVRIHAIDTKQECVMFEGLFDSYDLFKSMSFRHAVSRFGVTVVFDYPYSDDSPYLDENDKKMYVY